MQIAGRKIGIQEKPFIMAEVGINHNGDIETAFSMIETAKKLGFEAVKFQTFHAAEFNIDDTAVYTYKSQGKEITESMLQMFQRYEFSKSEWKQIKQKCDDEEIMFLSTPQNVSDLEILLEVGVPAIKVGSDDFTNLPLLREYRKANLPMILSCGMADLSEIFHALEAVEAFSRDDVALLLCTSEYPTPTEDVNLLKLRTLRGAFPALTLGFSDHTKGELAAGMAVAFEACIFEKHYTLEHNMPGPDHWFSANPEELKKWHDTIVNAWNILGKAELIPTQKEKEMKKIAQRSLYTVKAIPAGMKITADMVGMFRPSGGIGGEYWDLVLGTYATQDLPAKHLLKWGDFHA